MGGLWAGRGRRRHRSRSVNAGSWGDARQRRRARVDGKLKQKEDVATGLENAPHTLVRLFTGDNFGKQLLKISDPPLDRVN